MRFILKWQRHLGMVFLFLIVAGALVLAFLPENENLPATELLPTESKKNSESYKNEHFSGMPKPEKVFQTKQSNSTPPNQPSGEPANSITSNTDPISIRRSAQRQSRWGQMEDLIAEAHHTVQRFRIGPQQIDPRVKAYKLSQLQRIVAEISQQIKSESDPAIKSRLVHERGYFRHLALRAQEEVKRARMHLQQVKGRRSPTPAFQDVNP